MSNRSGCVKPSKSTHVPNKYVILLLAILLHTLTGCVTQTSLNASKQTALQGYRGVICNAFQPIRWDKLDTDETITQVKAHNAVWLDICGEVVRPPESALLPR